MANESLSGFTSIDYSVDIPMTINEVFLSNSLVDFVMDIPMTINETNLNFTIVEGINDIITSKINSKLLVVGGAKSILGKIIII